MRVAVTVRPVRMIMVVLVLLAAVVLVRMRVFAAVAVAAVGVPVPCALAMVVAITVGVIMRGADLGVLGRVVHAIGQALLALLLLRLHRPNGYHLVTVYQNIPFHQSLL